MNLSSYSIRHPIPAIVLFILLGVAGFYSFRELTVQQDPDIDFPIVTVTTSLPGASPNQLENEVARKIEHSLSSVSQIRHVTTLIQDGVVVTDVEFRFGKDISEAMNDVRDAVNEIRTTLPSEINDPIFSKATTTGRPILTYAVSSDHLNESDLSWFVDETISKKLLALPGVGRVQRVGGVEREVLVELDPVRMTAANVSAPDVSQLLLLVQQEASGGKAGIGGGRQSVRILATARSATDIAALPITLPDGRQVQLRQIATVSDSTAERKSIALLDGKSVVGFEVSRSKGAGELDVAAEVRAAIARLNASEQHIVVTEAFDAISGIQKNYAESMRLIYEGALLSVLVVGLFMRDWRATLVAAVALPLSIIPTFFAMLALGFTLNMITLLALSLVVGILVDDAIVEIENVIRHLRMGKTPYRAAMDAAEEIGLAVVATTFALVAVFLPTAFMQGYVGQYFKQFGWTAATAVLSSLLVARLLTPMMAAYLIKPALTKEEDKPTPLTNRYLGLVSWCLSHRRTTVALAIALFVGSLGLIPLLPTGFLPPSNANQTKVSLELAPGATLQQTHLSAERARVLMQRVPDVASVFSVVSASGQADLTVNLRNAEQRTRRKTEVDQALRAALVDLPGARVTVGNSGNAEMLDLTLLSEDGPALERTSQAIVREIRGIRGIGNVNSSSSLVKPELVVTPDFAKAAELGVNAATIGETLRIATAGDYDIRLAKLNLPERQVPIRVRLPEGVRQDLEQIAQLKVRGNNQIQIPVGVVANLRIDGGPSRIERLDRMRQVTITAELNGLQLGDVMEQVDALPSVRILPPNVMIGESGNAELMHELFSGFGISMLAGLLCVYLVLVLLFKNFLHPLTILVALPLSFGGAFTALLLTNSAFSMPALIGILMLMGIASKNSILLVEYTILARRDHGMSRFDSLISACRYRARAIIMTSIAMVAGMLPTALSIGSSSSFRAPMAITVIGGIVTSTLLSLIVIPVIFTYIDDLVSYLMRLTGLGRPVGMAPN
ncbi:efflux RND transporter permease subunit [Xanthomonas sacchari]|uniref:efflux RND transporter permease subunit n=1 Tax=Xanthomonas sacchari TaxID=56458 RepID=UPI00225517A5|nr:efflux RND transporter permease subunit [Xanthomonas sacchari]MCW0372976.1 Multidrug resistance protein MdtC [Xanthomonas sacchari]MCW0411595.1 Multidrug resistance protein MdtC [Xanthomonas sacchari]UYK68505.1 efflux RND transporter permease subunit [Xanthomonas sacchari]